MTAGGLHAHHSWAIVMAGPGRHPFRRQEFLGHSFGHLWGWPYRASSSSSLGICRLSNPAKADPGMRLCERVRGLPVSEAVVLPLFAFSCLSREGKTSQADCHRQAHSPGQATSLLQAISVHFWHSASVLRPLGGLDKSVNFTRNATVIGARDIPRARRGEQMWMCKMKMPD